MSTNEDGLFEVDFGSVSIPSSLIEVFLYPSGPPQTRFEDNLFVGMDVVGCGSEVCEEELNLMGASEFTGLSNRRRMRAGVEVLVEKKDGTVEEVDANAYATVDQSTASVVIKISKLTQSDLSTIAMSAM